MKEDHLWDLLKVCIKDDERSSALFTKLKGDKTPPNDIVALKTQFLDFYSGQTWQGSQLSQLSSLAMGKEQPSTYNSRLSTMCLSMGIKMDAKGDQGFQLLKKTLFNRLPFVVQNTLQAKAKEVIENGTIQDFMDLIVDNIPHAPTHVVKALLHCQYCPQEVDYACNCETGRLFSRPNSKKDNIGDRLGNFGNKNNNGKNDGRKKIKEGIKMRKRLDLMKNIRL